MKPGRNIIEASKFCWPARDDQGTTSPQTLELIELAITTDHEQREGNDTEKSMGSNNYRVRNNCYR